MSDPPPVITDLPTDPPLPPRLAWFAPWRWFPRLRPWQRGLLFATMVLLAYVLSPMPLSYVARRTNAFATIPFLLPVLTTVYAPLEWCYRKVPAVETFYDTQREWLEACFGPMP